jgi:hypothetical protein
MSAKRQRTTFAKNQREKARMDKAALKRARRQARKLGSDAPDTVGDGSYRSPTPPADQERPQSG